MIGLSFEMSDITPIITCECKMRFFGDASVDAWRAWYKHAADKHPEVFQ
jgi:hypothetical protein